MKTKSTLVIACLALAFLMTVGTTAAQAQSCCCYGEWIVGAPLYCSRWRVDVNGGYRDGPF